MDAAAFRWVLIAIALLVLLAIYFYGRYQSRLRQRSSIDNVTREEIDSAFVEDEQLRSELDNLNPSLDDAEYDDDIADLEITPVRVAQPAPRSLPDPELFEHAAVAACNPDRLVSYHLRHDDFRLVTGEEAGDARRQVGLQLGDSGLLEYRENDRLLFRVASLSKPGEFHDIDSLEFVTLGFNCFIDLDSSEDAVAAYEALLRKVDELVRVLNVKVYKPTQELLTISDVTAVRDKLRS